MDGCWSRTSEGVYQEYWAIVLLFTLMTLKFNEIEDEEQEQKDPPTSRINRRVVFGSLKLRYLQVLLSMEDSTTFEEDFLDMCRKHRVPIRPGRSFPRPSVETRKTRHCYRRTI